MSDDDLTRQHRGTVRSDVEASAEERDDKVDSARRAPVGENDQKLSATARSNSSPRSAVDRRTETETESSPSLLDTPSSRRKNKRKMTSPRRRPNTDFSIRSLCSSSNSDRGDVDCEDDDDAEERTTGSTDAKIFKAEDASGLMFGGATTTLTAANEELFLRAKKRVYCRRRCSCCRCGCAIVVGGSHVEGVQLLPFEHSDRLPENSYSAAGFRFDCVCATNNNSHRPTAERRQSEFERRQRRPGPAAVGRSAAVGGRRAVVGRRRNELRPVVGRLAAVSSVRSHGRRCVGRRPKLVGGVSTRRRRWRSRRKSAQELQEHDEAATHRSERSRAIARAPHQRRVRESSPRRSVLLVQPAALEACHPANCLQLHPGARPARRPRLQRRRRRRRRRNRKFWWKFAEFRRLR